MIFFHDLFFQLRLGVGSFTIDPQWVGYVPIFQKSKVSVAHFGLVTGAHLPFFRPNEGRGASREKCGKHLLGSEKQFAPQNFYRNPNFRKACVKKNIIISGVNSLLNFEGCCSRGVEVVVQGRKNTDP